MSGYMSGGISGCVIGLTSEWMNVSIGEGMNVSIEECLDELRDG